MSPSRSTRSSHGHNKGTGAQRSVRRMIESLQSHNVNTLTELVRIERIAASCNDESDAVAFQGPMTEAWNFYVSTNQFLTELRGLTSNYPFCGEILTDAQIRVRNDPESNRSWNMAWLCLHTIVHDNLVSTYATLEASRPEMWGGRDPSPEEADQLARCFEFEWNHAVNTMLRHWPVTPTWY